MCLTLCPPHSPIACFFCNIMFPNKTSTTHSTPALQWKEMIEIFHFQMKTYLLYRYPTRKFIVHTNLNNSFCYQSQNLILSPDWMTKLHTDCVLRVCVAFFFHIITSVYFFVLWRRLNLRASHSYRRLISPSAPLFRTLPMNETCYR